MTFEPFFRVDAAGAFVPNDICRGPWDPNSLHGRVIAGLLAYEIERRWGDPAFQCARLTVDLYRMPPFAPVELKSHVVRDGKRIRVVDAEFICHGKPVARASAVLLRRSENPPGTVWSPPPWDAAAPTSLEKWAGPGGDNEDPMWETRVIDYGFGSTERKRTWLRETRVLVEGVALTPLVRAAVAADFASPLAHSGSNGLQFVNVDITLYLSRLPVGEWLGFEVIAHQSDDGIAVGECVMHDEQGAIGRSLVAAIANRR